MIESFVRPYYLQPDKILPFLTRERQKWPSSVATEFYISFEDALWSLLPRLGYAAGSIIMLPDFYCKDVIDNIEAHHYRVKTYPLNEDLTFTAYKIEMLVKRFKPDIFVDFAPAGIPNGISNVIFRKLPFHSLLILDRVHSLIEPTVDFFPHNDRTLLINSYRKVSPFTGALAVFSRNARQAQRVKSGRYILKGVLYWLSYLFILQVAKLLRSPRLVLRAAEQHLHLHDAHIGDLKLSAQLPFFMSIFPLHIDVSGIKSTKMLHSEIYLDHFHPILCKHQKKLFLPDQATQFLSEVRGFPLIIKEPFAQKFIEQCYELGLVVYAQLEDAVWSTKRKLILLPLGPHLKTKDIHNIAKIASKALTMALQCDIISA